MRPQRYAVRALIACFALSSGSCEDRGVPYEQPVVEGGLCSSREQYCLNAGQILTCQDRRWTVQKCADVCAQYSANTIAKGCLDQGDGRGDYCECWPKKIDPGGGTCYIGNTRCVGQDRLAVCVDWQWVEHECNEVCSYLDPPRNSRGCFQGYGGFFGIHDACACTLEGTACDPSFPDICNGVSTVARCVDGLWEIEDCAPQCGLDQQPVCRSWGVDDQALCTCEPVK